MQVDDSEQDIEPEIFYLEYHQISDVKVEKKVVRLFQAQNMHPCIEKFFSQSGKYQVIPLKALASYSKHFIID